MEAMITQLQQSVLVVQTQAANDLVAIQTQHAASIVTTSNDIRALTALVSTLATMQVTPTTTDDQYGHWVRWSDPTSRSTGTRPESCSDCSNTSKRWCWNTAAPTPAPVTAGAPSRKPGTPISAYWTYPADALVIEAHATWEILSGDTTDAIPIRTDGHRHVRQATHDRKVATTIRLDVRNGGKLPYKLEAPAPTQTLQETVVEHSRSTLLVLVP
jgi:hypothetical protein